MATAYDKWGMTNRVAAALRIAGEITGNPAVWAERLASSTDTTDWPTLWTSLSPLSPERFVDS